MVRVGSLDDAMQLINDHEYGNGTCLFTRDGETIEPMPGSPVDAAATELLRKSRIRPAGGR